MIETLPIVPATEAHRNFILATWVRSYEASARRLQLGGLRLPTEVYRAGESLLAEQTWSNCKVVTSPDDSYTIHAWVCGKPGRLYHVYVPPQLRGNGVAKGLVELVSGTEYSVHKPWPSQPKKHHVTWNPYL